ncbi:uncharacterized protein F5147DRAFT_649673 [Suillus discolor]|uniref:DUF6532 domain-containing protein n=1 Tax=Suillus discolor TaxID=1912936 RepID=A0A9P7JY42_9AGAM|nr:uncharacterized protein F5147DRAFT_649673 [Suillus discolor]KAG2115295.1 hypothetical protein F5147DRAFT_649673 [Suillus discolor]
MSKVWELEEINRWKRFSKHTIATLQKEHRKQISRDSADTIQTYRREQEALAAVQMDLVDLEGLASSRGVADGDLIQEGTDDDDKDSAMSDDNSIFAHVHLDRGRADSHASWHGTVNIESPSFHHALQGYCKKTTSPTKKHKSDKKPGRKLDLNPSLQPDSTQLGLQEEYTQPPLLYSHLSAMMEGYDDNEGEEEEEEEARNDQRGSYQEDHQPLPYDISLSPTMGGTILCKIRTLVLLSTTNLFSQTTTLAFLNIINPFPITLRHKCSMMICRLPVPLVTHALTTNLACHHPASNLLPPITRHISYLPESRNSSTLHAQGSEVSIECKENASSANGLAESQRGQLITTGIIRLTDKELKDVKKEAKQVMCRKVLLENAMPTMERNTEMAEEAFLEAAGHVVSDHAETCKKLSGIMTTVRGVFKKEAQWLILNHYSLSLSCPASRQPQLSLFMSPVNHPAVIETICNSLWTTHLHEALDFNELDKLNDLFSIGGTAVHNTLLEFQDGVYKSVQFSPASLSATEYKAIQTHNTIVHDTPTLHSASLSVKQNMIALGMALRAH